MKKTWFIIIAISLILSFINSIHFFIGLIDIPQSTVYTGITHYYEDYFFYLNHFLQGSTGEFLTTNRYTSELTQKSTIYWINLLLGKIGGILGLDTILTYNLSTELIVFLLLILSFIVFLKIFNFLGNKKYLYSFSAFIIYTFSSSLINIVNNNMGQKVFWPFQLWKTPHFAFDRLGNAPHQLTQTLFYLICTYFLFRDKKSPIITFLCVLFIVLLTSLNPVQGSFLILTIYLTLIISKIIRVDFQYPTKIRLFWTTLSFVIVFIYMYTTLNTIPHIQTKIWESENNTITTFSFLLLSVGPVVIPIIFGLFHEYIKKPIFIFSILNIFISYIIFLSPIPGIFGFSNLRILFPSTYFFFGIIGTLGFEKIYQILSKFNIKHVSLQLIIVIFFILNLPTILWEINFKITTVDKSSHLYYLNSGIYDLLLYLKSIKPYDDIALASPISRIDLILPAFSGHTGFTGHFLATYDNSNKSELSKKFYNLEMNESEALQFLLNAKIKYIVFTSLDKMDGIKNKYSFLHLTYENNNGYIFKVIL